MIGSSLIERVVEILFVNNPDAEIILFLLKLGIYSERVLISSMSAYFMLSIEIEVLPPDLLFSINVLS